MGKRLALLAIRLLVSVNLLYAAIFLKFAGVPGSVTLFTQMSQAVHGLVSQPVFRLGSGVFETVVAVLLLIPKTARLGARLTVVWMTAVILSHIFVLGYGWFFVDALMVMLLAVIYLLLTRRQSHWGEPESVGTTAPYKRTKNSRANSWKRSHKIRPSHRSRLEPRITQEIMATQPPPPAPLPPFTRECDSKGPPRRGWLEHSRPGESSPGLRDRFTMEEPLGVHQRTKRNHCFPHSQVGQGVGLPAHQGTVGVHREPHRGALRLRVARRLGPLVSLLWQ